jgi:L-threonylcarbamoyladenylate synthase
MKIVPFSDEALLEAVAVLKNGGVVAHATETCYGLACDLSNPAAVKKLFTIKQRPEHQPVSGLFASVDEAKRYVEWNDRTEELANQYLPGPLTLILRLKSDAPKTLYPILLEASSYQLPATIGIRISSSPIAQALADAYQSPISTTSANLHGQTNPYSADDIVAQMKDRPAQPDLILDSGILPQNPPSTVMDLTGETEAVKRQGKI